MEERVTGLAGFLEWEARQPGDGADLDIDTLYAGVIAEPPPPIA
jgi:hypothetical protein